MADAAENENRIKKQKTDHIESKGKETKADPTSTKMPKTYPYIDDTVTEDHRRQRLGHDGIITDCKPCECEGGFEYYSDEFICFDGEWQAVWTSHNLGCDVLVLVKKKCFPNALVELVEPFCCSHPNSYADFALDGSGQKPKTKDDITKFLSARKHKVPLLELLPLLEQPKDLNKKEKTEDADGGDEDEEDEDDSDDESSIDISEIAEFLELYRFFYTYMWRVIYDENHGGEYMFQCPAMFYRMMLHYEVKHKKTSSEIMESYNKTMTEYIKKAWQFKAIRNDHKNPKQDKELRKIGKQVTSLEKTLEKLKKQNQKERVFRR